MTQGQSIKYQCHIGGGYYVSVTTGFLCVDFRKFFKPYNSAEVKPTRKGVALRLNEWIELRHLIDTIHATYPTLGTAVPCYLNDDHQNQLGALQCRECYPFTAEIY